MASNSTRGASMCRPLMDQTLLSEELLLPSFPRESLFPHSQTPWPFFVFNPENSFGIFGLQVLVNIVQKRALIPWLVFHFSVSFYDKLENL